MNKTLDKVLSLLEARVQELTRLQLVQGCSGASVVLESRLDEVTEILHEVRCLVEASNLTKTNKK